MEEHSQPTESWLQKGELEGGLQKLKQFIHALICKPR